MKITGTNKIDLCKEYSCDVTKTENGLTITLSSDDKVKVEKLHEMTDCCTPECCKDSSDKSASCC